MSQIVGYIKEAYPPKPMRRIPTPATTPIQESKKRTFKKHNQNQNPDPRIPRNQHIIHANHGSSLHGGPNLKCSLQRIIDCKNIKKTIKTHRKRARKRIRREEWRKKQTFVREHGKPLDRVLRGDRHSIGAGWQGIGREDSK